MEKKHGTSGSPTIREKKDYFEMVIKMYNITEKQNVIEIIWMEKIEPVGKIKTQVEIENDSGAYSTSHFYTIVSAS